MFEIYKRAITGDYYIVSEHYKKWNAIAFEILMNKNLLRAKLFNMPDRLPHIKAPKKGNDKLFSPYHTIWIEDYSNTLGICLTEVPESLVKQILKEEPNKTGINPLYWQELNGKIHPYLMFIFCKRSNNRLMVSRAHFLVDKNGNFVEVDSVYENDALNEISAHSIAITLTFLRFINLSNIKILKTPLDRKTIKHIQKRNSIRTHYHILTVVKPSKQMGSGNHGIDNESSIALHQVRGHLADYTQGKGLFGKYNIRIWIPDFWKGDLKYGKVNKDYKLKKKIA